MLSSSKLKSVCLLLILLLTIFLPPTAFCEKKSEATNTTAEPIGTTGVLSIGPNGNIYIQFTESHAKFTVGNLIMGEMPIEELTLGQADQHEFQKAAYIAYDAWLKCEEAKKQAADGKITQVQMEFVCARSRVRNFEEVSIWATAILDNNMGKDIPLAAPLSEIVKLEIEEGKQQEQYYLDLGAEPTAEGYEPPGFTADIIPFNTSDPIISDKLVIDSLPIVDTDAVHEGGT
jgi:hypothetical protein